MIFVSGEYFTFVSDRYNTFVSSVKEGKMQIKIQVLDDQGNPVPGVLVQGQLDLSIPPPPPQSVPIDGTTDGNGEI